MKSSEFHPEIWWISWNLADFMKSMKSGRFHPWNLVHFTHKIRQISAVKSSRFQPWNLADFSCEIQWISPVKSGRFNSWNLADFTHEIQQISPMKSGRFHDIREIRQISWNPLDFTLKSGRFHLKIWWISWNPLNLADFTQISPVKSTQNYKSKCFSKNSSVWWMQGGGYDQGFHEIHPEIWWISPMKSGRFHPDFTCEIHPNYKSKCFSKNSSVWWMQGGGFHPRNPVDFNHEIWRISPMKSGGFHPDFTCEIHPKL